MVSKDIESNDDKFAKMQQNPVLLRDGVSAFLHAMKILNEAGKLPLSETEVIEAQQRAREKRNTRKPNP